MPQLRPIIFKCDASPDSPIQQRKPSSILPVFVSFFFLFYYFFFFTKCTSVEKKGLDELLSPYSHISW